MNNEEKTLFVFFLVFVLSTALTTNLVTTAMDVFLPFESRNERVIEKICRCSSEGKYKAFEFCISRTTEVNITEWEELKEDFFSDTFIKDYLVYGCGGENE